MYNCERKAQRRSGSRKRDESLKWVTSASGQFEAGSLLPLHSPPSSFSLPSQRGQLTLLSRGAARAAAQRVHTTVHSTGHEYCSCWKRSILSYLQANKFFLDAGCLCLDVFRDVKCECHWHSLKLNQCPLWFSLVCILPFNLTISVYLSASQLHFQVWFYLRKIHHWILWSDSDH